MPHHSSTCGKMHTFVFNYMLDWSTPKREQLFVIFFLTSCHLMIFICNTSFMLHKNHAAHCLVELITPGYKGDDYIQTSKKYVVINSLCIYL